MFDQIKKERRSLAAALAVAAIVAAGTVCLEAPARAQVPSYSQPVLQRPTFSSVVAPLVAPVLGDSACLVGSATQNIYVTKVRIGGTIATAAANVAVELVKRTVANTGGTSTTPAVASYDSGNAAATAVFRAYTVAPTAGTGVALGAANIFFPVTGTGANNPSAVWEFTPQTKLNQQVILRGVAQALCVNYPVTTTNATSLSVEFEWTE